MRVIDLCPGVTLRNTAVLCHFEANCHVFNSTKTSKRVMMKSVMLKSLKYVLSETKRSCEVELDEHC